MGFFSEIGDFLKNPLDYLGEQLGEQNAQAVRDQQRNQYQNTVYDLRQAGLNPSLAYMNGANSSGSQSSIDQIGNPINTALSVAQLGKTMSDSALASASARDMDAKASVNEKIADFYDKNPSEIGNKVRNENSPRNLVQAVSNGIRTITSTPQGKKAVQGVISPSSNSAKDASEKLNKLGSTIRNFFSNKMTPGSFKTD